MATGMVFAGKDKCTTIQSGGLFTSDDKVITTGYDQYGYNYQAHMFNGRYCDYDRVEGGSYCDVNLVMKWNDAWLSNKDCGVDSLLDRHYGFDNYIGSGAWLTNHQWGTYEDENEKTCKWEYFVKIVAVPSDAYRWNVLGDWVLEFDYKGGKYVHDMTVDSSLEGTGAAQFSSQTWTVSGDVNGNAVDFTILYDSSTYEVYVLGTISYDGKMGGTWSTNTGQSGTWKSTYGTATMDDVWYSADGTEIGPEIWGAFAIIQQVENDQCTGIHGLQYLSPTSAGFGYYK